MEPIVYFSRLKPQKADIIDLSIKYNKVFIGYPPFIQGKVFDPSNIRSSTFDISKGIDKMRLNKRGSNIARFTTNVNLVNDVKPGSYVIIPRPERGVYYAAKVKNFELVDKPTWIDEYREIRLAQGLDWDDPQNHIGDVIQAWNVEEFREITPYKVPGWIRHSLFGRATSGRIYDYDDNNVAHQKIDRLYHNQPIRLVTTRDKLLHFLTPEVFEHFIANLFLLEFDETWVQMGGSGDGGIDCTGFKEGETIGVAQCKLKKQSLEDLEDILDSMPFPGRKYVANFYCEDHLAAGEKLGIFNQDRILELFERHPESNYWKIINSL
jgi:hypothetical protein